MTGTILGGTVRTYDVIGFGDEVPGILAVVAAAREFRRRTGRTPRSLIMTPSPLEQGLGGHLVRGRLSYLDRSHVKPSLRKKYGLKTFGAPASLYEEFLKRSGVLDIGLDWRKADRALRAMASESGIDLLGDVAVTQVLKDGAAIAGLQLRNGETYTGTIFIDSTVNGQLVQAAGGQVLPGFSTLGLPDSALPVTLVFESQGLSVERLQKIELTAIARFLNPNDTQAQGYLRIAATGPDGQVNTALRDYWLRGMRDSNGNPRKMAVGRDFIDVRCHALSILYHAYRGTQLNLEASGAIFDVANVARLPGDRLSWNSLLCFVNATEAGVLAQNHGVPADWMREEMNWVSRWMRSLGATIVEPAPELYIRFTGGLANPRRSLSGAQMLAGGVTRSEALGTFSYRFDVRGGIPGLGAKAASKNYKNLRFLSEVVPSFNYGIEHSLPRSIPNISLISPASGFRGVGASAGRIVEFNCGVGQGVGIAAAIALTQNRTLATIPNREVQQVLAATGQLPTLYGVGYQEAQAFNTFERDMQPDKLEPGSGGSGGSGSDPFAIDDVTGHWAAPFIEVLRSRGTLRGYPDGSFRPDAGLTRAEFAAALVEAFELPLQRSPKNFNDIAPNFWAKTVITKAVQMGFLSGFPNNMFRPQAGLTRAQTWVALVSGLELEPSTNLDITALYGDVQEIPSYAQIGVNTASDRLLVVNHPELDRLNPRRPITRGELAATLYQALVTLAQVPPLDHPNIVRPVDILNPPQQDPPALDIIESTAPSQSMFVDIAQHWARSCIECLVLEGILTGVRSDGFAPDSPMNRLDFVQVIARALPLSSNRPGINFTDIPEIFWAHGLIQQVYQAGFINPLENNQFLPNQAIARRDVILGLSRGLGWPMLEDDTPQQLRALFEDANELATDEVGAIVAAVDRSIVLNANNPTLLELDRPASRAEVAAMVYQTLVAEGQFNPISDSGHEAFILTFAMAAN